MTGVMEYLESEFPEIHTEVREKLTGIECNKDLLHEILNKVELFTSEVWKVRHLAIASALLVCSPETILSGRRVRKGVSRKLSTILGISHAAINGRLEQVRHYYKHNAWTRESVDKIVKEVKG